MKGEMGCRRKKADEEGHKGRKKRRDTMRKNGGEIKEA